ncbi:TetR/AcrR family transcriptional regulator [Sulfurovum sp. CS9]|uniref:TetR/AcrR family transcriptional regulator n=1 Tax=Sulfurovum sp. CS9 TaxID=3391146 RepID=UPI0039EC87A0
MAIIVNKEEKRSNIACSCKEILLEHGIKNLTISQIAKTAGVGKGTIYEYFKNKEDIVFEIITMFISEHEKKLFEITDQNISTKDKLFHFFYMIHEDENSNKQLNIYREFLAISMTNGTQEMVDFNIKCRGKFTDILGQIVKEGITKGEIHTEAQDMVSALLTFKLGLVVETHTAALDPKDEITRFLDALFKLIEIKEEK